ncbi:MAG: flavodoxin-dependent (E)-4-hydroxy-3-methylbut-2-enyl-diphosphate synthase [Clostridiales bacterium]|jgi:(E)-4-hydroxy-3-methylbut-2-enyl-diphosphate synthase|nr:flavodoxin-dependent (E)-4-hydroxy-3-methylbut-2-enyl-diphosphate synthase [Oscillospiraceae bacterium]MBQ1246731.1 flavodoxin-dependent (E)-4-hydroxy-3-methylbut-2-enyl-diphosphate synthase [Clostridiales bacterium]MBQ1297804.1 flavodoxin-dependent (E)-4-hydroxy-3-methylbut-2-enyl-diphosphate synthase [Clostridiales bacterium]MBQ1572239.1 flavodoxin-dependent (E)-4-hydroxy-3-methylbut-2-enyl-diphosphate synthase [Clostridiales bacterium]MBQ5768172.1 flavodoxin-dependent (E)-4-hydroxy-3-meth
MTKKVLIGNVEVGGGSSVKIQSMNNTDTRDAKATLAQIQELADNGCDITRVAIPDMEAAESLKEITSNSPIPVVADIHFDYRLALAAADNGASKIRINPGNIGGPENVKLVADKCKERHIPIRVGVNSGSISREILAKYGEVNADAMTESALGAVKLLEDQDFDDIVISIKSSSPRLTIDTYRILSKSCDYPLHVGVTEAGTVREGAIKSAVGIGALLAEGIGDTIRVSLTGNPVDEVITAKQILKALDLRDGGITFISCPTCGRTQVPLIELAGQIEQKVSKLPYNLKVAVMGCVVNGPGEARECDIGIAGGKDEFVLFEKGVPVRKIPASVAVEEFVREVIRVGEEKSKAT